jgi:hypothetical protein
LEGDVHVPLLEIESSFNATWLIAERFDSVVPITRAASPVFRMLLLVIKIISSWSRFQMDSWKMQQDQEQEQGGSCTMSKQEVEFISNINSEVFSLTVRHPGTRVFRQV